MRPTLSTPTDERNVIHLVSDSGQVSAFRPAQHIKPQATGILGRIQGVFSRFRKRPDPAKTTEQGSAGTSSPAVFEYTLHSERYERRMVIADVRQMVIDDPRARRSTLKFAREAVRKGVRITVLPTKGTKAQRAAAQKAADAITKIVNPHILSWAWMLGVEGDSFIQAIVSGNSVVGAKRMPASSMERCTDDTDEFVDVTRAFAQVDTNTNEDIATFPEALIWHGRWDHIDGERYGTSMLVAARRLRRLLEVQEDSQAIRRMTRAPARRLWNVGTEEHPGEPAQVKAWKEDAGFVEGKRQIWDPTNVAEDYFGNGRIGLTPDPGDAGVADIEDLKYAQDVYVNAGLPTPSALIGVAAESINRDVLEDQRAEWLKETVALSDLMKECCAWLIELQLLLWGVIPEALAMDYHFSESSVEKPSEVVERVSSLRGNALPDFTPDPLVSRKKAMELLAEIIDVSDIDAELKAIQEELDQIAQHKMEQQMKQQQAAQAMGGGAPGGAPGAEGAGGPPMPGDQGMQAPMGAGAAQGAPGAEAPPPGEEDENAPPQPNPDGTAPLLSEVLKKKKPAGDSIEIPDEFDLSVIDAEFCYTYASARNGK